MNAPAVDVATGKAPVDAASEAEQSYLTFLSIYFIWTLVLGLALAGAVGGRGGGGEGRGQKKGGRRRALRGTMSSAKLRVGVGLVQPQEDGSQCANPLPREGGRGGAGDSEGDSLQATGEA